MDHATDTSRATTGAFLIALAIVLALVIGFVTMGVTGIGLVMVAITPVAYLVMVLVSIGQ